MFCLHKKQYKKHKMINPKITRCVINLDSAKFPENESSEWLLEALYIYTLFIRF